MGGDEDLCTAEAENVELNAGDFKLAHALIANSMYQ